MALSIGLIGLFKKDGSTVTKEDKSSIICSIHNYEESVYKADISININYRFDDSSNTISSISVSNYKFDDKTNYDKWKDVYSKVNTSDTEPGVFMKLEYDDSGLIIKETIEHDYSKLSKEILANMKKNYDEIKDFHISLGHSCK